MSDEPMGIPEHRETVERLERGVARVKPPDDLFDRIVAETQPARVIPLRRRFTSWASPAATAAVAAAAAVLVTVAVTRDDGLGDPVRRASITGTNVRGTAALYRPDERDGLVVLDLDRVPDPPRAHYYEIWISRPGGRKVPIGAFTPEDGKAHLELPLPTPGKYLSIDISVEEEDGPPDHSGRSIAAARLA
jgi:anti-sigma-K factor RskA